MNLAKSIFEMQLGIMKNTLKLMEFRFGKENEAFRYVKEQLMNYTYDGLKKFYQQGVIDSMFEKCECGASLRKGWTSCGCGGSGFLDRVEK